MGHGIAPASSWNPPACVPLNLTMLSVGECSSLGQNLRLFRWVRLTELPKDPLRKYIDKCGWRGVVIEPQPRAANQLRELYRHNKRIIILQAALDGKSGRRTLYMVDAPRAPAWAGGLASFQRDTILKHSDLIPGLETMILEDAVDCVTFDEVLEVVRRKQIDLLQIDTEGADGHILSLFPFDRVQPAIIHWEVKHLSTSEREACLDRLAAFAYRFAPSGDEDMLAVLNAQSATQSSST